jgi:hypothetical protein
MQVVACIFPQEAGRIKAQIESVSFQRLPGARTRGAPVMIGPVIILGALTLFVVWDTMERR